MDEHERLKQLIIDHATAEFIRLLHEHLSSYWNETPLEDTVETVISKRMVEFNSKSDEYLRVIMKKTQPFSPSDTLITEIINFVHGLHFSDTYRLVQPLDNTPQLSMYCDMITNDAVDRVAIVCVFPALMIGDKMMNRGLCIKVPLHDGCWSYIQEFDLKAYMGEWHEIAYVESFFESNRQEQVTANYSLIDKEILGEGWIDVKNQGASFAANGVGNVVHPGVLEVTFPPIPILPPPLKRWPSKSLAWIVPVQFSRFSRKGIALDSVPRNNNGTIRV
jgi:hypothetical protein